MVSLQTQTATRGDITLIGGIVDARSVPSGVEAYTVTLSVEFDGAVWVPPEQRSQWDRPHLTIVVPENRCVGVGIAGRGTPGAQPLTIADVCPAGSADSPPTPREVLRRLGDPRPPTEALPESPQEGDL